MSPEAMEYTLKTRISRRRYEHSLRTAETAEGLAGRFSCDPDEAYIAGLLHDCARELPPEEILSLATEDGVDHVSEARQSIILLHGRAGAVIARRDFAVRNNGILDAIRTHVTGKPGMSLLSRVVFLADYLEPGRPWMKEEPVKDFIHLSLREMLQAVLEYTLRYLKSEGRKIAEDSILLYDEVSNGIRT